MNKDSLFSGISEYLMKYETGDFLLLSDMSDACKSLKDFFLDSDTALNLIEWILRCIHTEMTRAGDENFQACMTHRIDLLQELDRCETAEQIAAVTHKISRYKCIKEKKDCADETAFVRDEETFQIFLTEATDRLDQAQAIILDLENGVDQKESFQNLFRLFHTIKGECGFLKIATLGEVTHNIESLMDSLRSKTIDFRNEHVDILLEGIDISRRILDQLKNGSSILFSDIPLDTYYKKLSVAASRPNPSLGELLVSEGVLKQEDVAKILQKQKESAFSKRFGEIAVKENFLSADELQRTLSKQKEGTLSPVQEKKEKHDPVIKVRASKVTFLVDMIGELLIAMGQMTDNTPALMQMRKITRSLQFGAMELRTDTVHSLFGNIKRVVRDLSKQLGKQVLLETRGENLEIDRNLIEKLEEPLIHMIRNSLDHGIEDTGERALTGKPPQASLILSAERRGNSIVISLRDDGRGLNRQKILDKAIAKGVIRPDMVSGLSDAFINNLIFASGFSTQDSVSQISGRGVGMDIVQSVVNENRGRIETETEAGCFTEFRLIFPLSTAIIDGMITRAGDNLLVFPIGSVVESLKITADMIHSVRGSAEVIDLRGEVLPVIRMHQALGIPEEEDRGWHVGIVTEKSDRSRYLLILDEIIAKREVVIKSLGNKFKNMKGITSGTVLSGGRIGLVIDVDQIVDLSLAEFAT